MLTLDRNECRTVKQIRAMARERDWPVTHWARIAAKLANQYGYIVVWLADDRMVEFSLEAGKVHRKTRRPHSWSFARP